MVKLYTKGGDDGTTGLLAGQRTSKADARIEACGTVDELNCALGSALCVCRHDELATILSENQRHLFQLGADLGSSTEIQKTGTSETPAPRIGPDHLVEAEKWIDELSDATEPLTLFILPGGSELSARLHTARSVCRCAERCCVALAAEYTLPRCLIPYLNRLSDLLFAMARRANQLEGVKDVTWDGGGPSTEAARK